MAKIKGNNGGPAGPRFLRKTDAAAILALLGLTGVLVWLTVVDSDKSNVSRRAIWVSCLLGPFGVILRWKLSVYNTAQPAALSWFPVGTYLANMIAVVIDYILAVTPDSNPYSDPNSNSSSSASADVQQFPYPVLSFKALAERTAQGKNLFLSGACGRAVTLFIERSARVDKG